MGWDFWDTLLIRNQSGIDEELFDIVSGLKAFGQRESKFVKTPPKRPLKLKFNPTKT